MLEAFPGRRRSRRVGTTPLPVSEATKMRYAGNFHPEWGYLSPAPSFVRTARVVLVAAAIGATAGAGVVFSLVGRADTETSVAARTLARPAEATSAQLNLPQPVAPAPATPAPGGQDHAQKALAQKSLAQKSLAQKSLAQKSLAQKSL